jgi:carboxymethylenebutenolidase
MLPTQPDGYFASPTANKGDAVLVLHAWWGLNATIKAFCDRLADSGFIVFAPDLYQGKVTDQISEAEVLGAALDGRVDQVRADLVKAAHDLKDRAGRSHLSVVGFSLGAFYALDLSVNAPDLIESVVLYYGTGPADFTKSKASYLGHFAEQDVYEPPAHVESLEKALRDAGRPATFYQYRATGHWFAEPDRADVYDPIAANLAWERTLEFLKTRSG